MPYLTDRFGNASSVHFFGQEARAAVDRARREVAELIGARANEIVFLSGGTEANNLALRGLCEAAEQQGRHIITSQIEHSSVRGICEALEKRGWEVTRLPVYEDGIVRVEDVHAAVRPDTVLISLMMANNEIGTIQPVQEVGDYVREKRARGHKLRFHTDAVQAAGRIPLDVEELGCDLLFRFQLTNSTRPREMGGLYIRRGVRVLSQNIGGHQERERRAGTEAVPEIVALGAAAKLARQELIQRDAHTEFLRDRF